MSRCNKLVDVGRRQFLKGGAIAAAGAATASVLPAGEAKAAQAGAILAIRPNASFDRLADFQENSGTVIIGKVDINRLVHDQIGKVAKPCRGIGEDRTSPRCLESELRFPDSLGCGSGDLDPRHGVRV